mmetsp:Transcript_99496/g.319277  ORF Transcript_99496/g.319277 Transcript_99496/m.319277 type:complete len:131 (+) Transcript_99496:1008-1400(+)
MIHSFSGQVHPHAQELEALAAAIGRERPPIAGVATRKAQLDEVVAALRKVAGEHALLDAAGVIAFFSAMTCVLDATGHKNFAIKDWMETMVSRVSAIRRRTRGKLLPFVLLASGLLGTFLVSSRLLRRAD